MYQTLRLTAGASYTIGFLGASRPGNVLARLGVRINDILLPGAASIDVYADFTQYAFVFNATAQTVIGFQNTADTTADQSAFVDAVTVCLNPPPPPPMTTVTATTRTVTATTGTIDAVQGLTIANLRTDLIALMARVAQLEADAAVTNAAIGPMQSTLTLARS